MTCTNNNNCSNNGVCVFGKCHCYPAYSGDTCEKIDNCFKTICQNHGLCDHKSGTCVCKGKYIGSYCELLDCGIHGNYDITSKTCICMAGYNGVYCDQCQLHPQNENNRTFVCCPIHNNQNGHSYLHLAVAENKLYKYLGGSIYSHSCVIPGHVTKSGVLLDCSCNVENKQKPITSHVSSRVISQNTITRMMIQSDPSIIGSFSDDIDTVVTTRKRDLVCSGPTGTTNSSGIALLVVACVILAAILIASIIWIVWSMGSSKKTLDAEEKLVKKEKKSKSSTKMSIKTI